MINVVDLENKWLKFKIKSYIPYLVIIFSIVTITILFFVVLDTDKSNKVPSKLINETVQVNTIKKQKIETKDIKPIPTKQPENKKIEEKTTENKIDIVETKNNTTVTSTQPIVTKQIDKVKQTKKKLLLKPSLNFIKEMQNDTLPYYESEEDTPKHKINTPVKNKAKTEEIKTPELKTTKPEEQKSSISIHRQNTQEDIHYVIKRFKINNNPALSLFIAKKYYELGEYRKSYNYALITNEINSNIEASWIIFAKSLVKLNEKDIAIKTLRTYYDHSGSNKAKILLDEIISGKFK
jgi:hypothetical protein